jgi:hypothetical protein
MSLLNFLASNFSVAYSFVVQYVQGPMLNSVPIQATTYRVHESAEVAKHVLVDLNGSKQTINDNIAPGPHVWTIEGYIGGFPSEHIGRKALMPSIKLFHDIIDAAYTARSPLPFVDVDMKTWPLVAIEELEFEDDPAVNNRLLIKTTLRELTILKVSVYQTAEMADGSPPVGEEMGLTAAAASSPAQAVALPLPLPPAGSPTASFLGQLHTN